jgi:hypothetical protein
MQLRWNIKRFKSFFIVGGSVLLALLLFLVSLWWGFEWRFHQTPKPATYAPPENRAETVRQDLDYLSQLLKLDRSFSEAARGAFETERRELIAKAGSLTASALEMSVSHAVALAGNGHSTVGWRSRRLNRIPIRVAWFDEGLFILRATDANAALLGAKVLGINDMTPEALLSGLAPYLSGTPEKAKADSPIFLESPAALSSVWPAMSSNSAQLSLQAQDGKLVECVVTAANPDPAAESIPFRRNLAPQRAIGEPNGWRALLSVGTGLPLSLQNPDHSVYSVPLDGGKGIYINLQKIENDDKGSLSDQLKSILHDISPETLRYAILDLRFDGGGDYTKTLGFTKQLPKRIAADGKLIILSSNHTFSAAIVTLARAKYFGGARSVVMGERAGDSEQFWAESAEDLVLPNAKIHVYYATGYHDWAAGCHDLTRCFWVNLLFDVPAGSLAPNVPLAWRFADYRINIDTVFEAAHRLGQTTLR